MSDNDTTGDRNFLLYVKWKMKAVNLCTRSKMHYT